MRDNMIVTSFPDLGGQFEVIHTVDAATGYTQVCITPRTDHAPIVIVDGISPDLHVGVYERGTDTPTRIDRNGAPV